MTPSAPIRVLLVDDSSVALAVMKRVLSDCADIEVVGTASNGQEALSLIAQTRPTVICTDYYMPQMNGLELTHAIMTTSPLPILVVSSVVRPEDTRFVFPLLQAGALDLIAKPESYDSLASREFINKIRLLANVFVFRRLTSEPSAPAQKQEREAVQRRIRLVAIGASTGGPPALQTILSKLPADFPSPVVCVQHISPGFLQGLVKWLTARCKLKIKVAANRETAMPGTVYFPADGTHLQVDRFLHLTISHDEPMAGHRPSVNFTFNTIAAACGNSVLAILLTGMGADGAEGLQRISVAGGVTIAQDEASCVVFGMPKAAIALGAAQMVLPPDAIANKVLSLVRRA